MIARARWVALARIAHEMACTVSGVSTPQELDGLRGQLRDFMRSCVATASELPLSTTAHCLDESLRNAQIALECWACGQDERHHFWKLSVQWDNEAHNVARPWLPEGFASLIEDVENERHES